MGDEFQQYYPLLFAIAYRMLGSASEAEDIVQEAYLILAIRAVSNPNKLAYLRRQVAPPAPVGHPAATT